ncbi:thiamine-phosphate pyrophosphorylase [Candidatus Scalindua japonica]|uniref:Thiamine-phosphate synthase n=1 Tax=Candidatus Scalindua japonica TaxID=1284222 RepID=A0A286U289_9BACT|nr:thiamine phosphate synthase [Candidatus Scalindua japonica]GAX62235.1 thiamine-phosphate pyrophosphorylase [Candidatus Scalindua japonica]
MTTKRDFLHKTRLYVLISSNIAAKPIKETVRLVIDGGADAIQLREKIVSDSDFISLAREVREITAKSGTLLIINDRVHVAREIDADGVHLGQQDMSVSEARDIIGHEKIIGVSTHSIIQAMQAQKDGADYIAIGPIYPTKTKEYEPSIGIDAIPKISGAVNIPIIAIGAITLENLNEVLKAGAPRVAICSAIICAQDILSTTKQFNNKLTTEES